MSTFVRFAYVVSVTNYNRWYPFNFKKIHFTKFCQIHKSSGLLVWISSLYICQQFWCCCVSVIRCWSYRFVKLQKFFEVSMIHRAAYSYRHFYWKCILINLIMPFVMIFQSYRSCQVSIFQIFKIICYSCKIFHYESEIGS